MTGQRESRPAAAPSYSHSVVAGDSERTPEAGDGTDHCAPCIHARTEGWWGSTIPKGYTHDRDSHRTYPGSQRWGSCARCGEVFAGTYAFDVHQRHDAQGEYTDDCFCSAVALVGKPNQADLPNVWAVSPAVRLYRRHASWGDYWGQEVPDFSAVAS